MNNSNVLIASGSRHTIPPVHNSPGVPRIIFQLTENDPIGLQFFVLSKYDKLIDGFSFDRSKYIHPKSNFTLRLFEYMLHLTPYRLRKMKYGFSQPDRIIYYKSIVRQAKKMKPEIVVTFMHFELFRMLKKAMPNSKHVFFFRSTDLLGRIGKKNIDFLIENSQGFLSNTKAPLRELKTYNTNISFPMACVYNAAPENSISKQEQSRLKAAFRVKFGLKVNDFVLGYAGRFSQEKSLIEIFKVIRLLKEEGIIIHLILAGDIDNEKTPDLNYYKELIAYKEEYLSSQIHFSGWITNSELFKFYYALDAGVLLSRYREGNSMFLIEAMSCGLPMIVTSVGGNTEIIKNNVSGFLIDPNKLEVELKRIIVDLQNDPNKRRTIGQGALKYVAKNHTKEIMINNFHNFLQKIKSIS